MRSSHPPSSPSRAVIAGDVLVPDAEFCTLVLGGATRRTARRWLPAALDPRGQPSAALVQWSVFAAGDHGEGEAFGFPHVSRSEVIFSMVVSRWGEVVCLPH
jgi:hypothetical protein